MKNDRESNLQKKNNAQLKKDSCKFICQQQKIHRLYHWPNSRRARNETNAPHLTTRTRKNITIT